MLLTIDPGNQTGWALWHTELAACGLGDPDHASRFVVVTSVWIESPVIYPRSKVPPNDVLKVALDAGRWKGRLETRCDRVELVTPARWKGQVPKEIHHPRIWGALSPAEKAIVEEACKGVAPSKRHNVIDAVGLGLWAQGRK